MYEKTNNCYHNLNYINSFSFQCFGIMPTILGLTIFSLISKEFQILSLINSGEGEECAFNRHIDSGHRGIVHLARKFCPSLSPKTSKLTESCCLKTYKIDRLMQNDQNSAVSQTHINDVILLFYSRMGVSLK